MNLMPGAVWRPIPVSPSRPRRSKGRAVVLHVAASEATSLFGFFSTASVDSHLYVAKSGIIEQYVDLDLQSYASMAANASTVSVETQGGVTNPDGEPWTDAQVASLAHIARWAHDTEGVPLQLMPDSRSSSRGIGWHRLGIDPWRVSGGEVWSSSRGKLCPGAAKIAQVPRIVALAQSPNPTPGGDLSMADAQSILDFLQNTTGADLRLINGKVDRVVSAVVAGDGAGPQNNFAWLYDQLAPRLDAQAAALASLAGLVAQGHGDLSKDEILATVDKAIRDATVNVDVNVNHPS